MNFDAILDQLADAVAARVVDRLRAGTQEGWLDQAQSSLGRRRHIAAVRRRLRSGDEGAVQIGRRYLLSREAHDAEMGRVGQTEADTTEEQIAQELGLRLVGGRK